MRPEHEPVRVGVTGHINLTPATERLVADAIRLELRRISARPVHGVTCLAAGTDQIFARAVRDGGGTYEVILPAPDYRDTIAAPARGSFDELLGTATRVLHTGHRTSGTAAYVAANRELLLRVQRLLAVWDGEPGCHDASTDRTVSWARTRGVPTTVIWPADAQRTPMV
ncbi:hypothetical protein HCA58_07380 [Micromonospora sp. HNM0581]|uniref:hypothetical protein n=1 Tax=Micromonospora sp. HNM0581 TaxID=2716341 RepID=UPI00146CB0EC|nr:hypothetical protein [Micromonospora sp. HNM0581]NLU78204.1 hypothetical protein [Micromonospora sp. HNM0581]